jgi:holliday junction DNA helicase RuvB
VNCEHLRPKTLDEMLGQREIKEKARIAIGAALARDEPLPHCLLTSAGGGLGKTSFAAIVANEMFAPFVATSGQCLMNPLDLRNLLVRVKARTVVLVDEAHTIGGSAAEELLIVLEENVINLNGQGAFIRIPLPPFTLIAATTQPEVFCSSPLGQRFGLHFHFDFYVATELRQIAENIFARWRIDVEPSVLDEIGQRARGTPRVALRLCERVRDVAQARAEAVVSEHSFATAMRVEGLDRLGLSHAERKILWRLRAAHPRPLSSRSLASALGVQVETISNFEQILIRYELAEIGHGGRRITERGLAHLEALRQESLAK